MSTNHTPEPWSVAEESFDNDGIQESVICGLDGRAAIAVTLEFGPNNPGMREANARRIAACVNACAGISTDDLELSPERGLFHLAEYADDITKQRDELLAALQYARSNGIFATFVVSELDAAIAKVKCNQNAPVDQCKECKRDNRPSAKMCGACDKTTQAFTDAVNGLMKGGAQ